MSRFSIALADKSAAGAMDPVRIVVKRIHFHTQKPVLQTLPAKHRVNAAGKRIEIIGSGLVELKSFKRFSPFEGFKTAKRCLFFLLFFLFSLFPFQLSAGHQVIETRMAEKHADAYANYHSDDGRDGSFRTGDVVPESNQVIHFTPFSIFLTALLLFIPVGIAICGIRTLSRKHEVVKEEPQEWNFCQTFALALLFLRVVLAIALHGKPITMKEYNMYWSLLGVGVDSAILYFGGFWKRKGE